jgi:hypothetical protein
METKEINTAPQVVKQVRRTPAQNKAFKAYRFAQQQEDRYLGSVFAHAKGQRYYEAETKKAYEYCKRLGMGVEHGL